MMNVKSLKLYVHLEIGTSNARTYSRIHHNPSKLQEKHIYHYGSKILFGVSEFRKNISNRSECLIFVHILHCSQSSVSSLMLAITY